MSKSVERYARGGTRDSVTPEIHDRDAGAREREVRPIVIFLHIPRTGGTGLTRVARRHVPRDGLFMIDGSDVARSLEELERMGPERQGRLGLIAGHAPFGIHEVLGGPSTYISIVRHPVERALSAYGYLRSWRYQELHEVARKMSLIDMLNEGLLPDHVDGQCRALAGAIGESVVERGELARLALQNIDRYFTTCGVTERYEETLVHLRHQLGWRRLWHSHQENTSKGHRPDNPSEPELVSTIERHNPNDLILYNEVNARLDVAAKAVVGWDKELARFRRTNGLLQPGWRVLHAKERAGARVRYALGMVENEGHQAGNAQPTTNP